MHTQPRHRCRPSPRALRLEVLEDRCLLSYTITDLGPNFLVNQNPHAINNLGQVLGLNSDLHVLMWDPATGIRDLGRGQGLAINDAGQVLGWAPIGGGTGPALWDSDGTVTPIPVDPIALSNAGQVIGSVGYFPDTRIRLWDPVSGVQDLGPLGSLGGDGFDDTTRDASGSGLVVGLSDPPNDVAHAFLWDGRNGMHDLGTLGPPDGLSFANAINSAGQVVGGAYDRSSHTHAFLYDGTMHDLGTLRGDVSIAKGINDMGVVVGFAQVTFTDSRGFVYADGVMTDLNDLIDPGSGLHVDRAFAINNAGRITADAQDAQGHQHSLVLAPDGGGAPRGADPGVFRLPVPVREATPIGGITSQPPANALPKGAPLEAVAPLPAGVTLRQTTDAVFAHSHRPPTPAPEGAWESDTLTLAQPCFRCCSHLSIH
jgi:probable HAF family extracellular repeat protein